VSAYTDIAKMPVRRQGRVRPSTAPQRCSSGLHSLHARGRASVPAINCCKKPRSATQCSTAQHSMAPRGRCTCVTLCEAARSWEPMVTFTGWHRNSAASLLQAGGGCKGAARVSGEVIGLHRGLSSRGFMGWHRNSAASLLQAGGEAGADRVSGELIGLHKGSAADSDLHGVAQELGCQLAAGGKGGQGTEAQVQIRTQHKAGQGSAGQGRDRHEQTEA